MDTCMLFEIVGAFNSILLFQSVRTIGGQCTIQLIAITPCNKQIQEQQKRVQSEQSPQLPKHCSSKTTSERHKKQEAMFEFMF